MAGVGKDDLEIHQGYTYRIRYTFPTGVSLSGASAVWEGRRGPGAADPALFSLSTALGTITVGQDASSLWYVEGLFTDEVTGAMSDHKKAEHELRITIAGEKPWGIKGKFDLNPEIIPS